MLKKLLAAALISGAILSGSTCTAGEAPYRMIQDCYIVEEGDTLDSKYAFVTHSELNAILNYRGGSLEGATLYVSLFPCNECAKAIIQCGIRTVVYDSDKYADSPTTIASKRMFDAAGVRYYRYQRTGRKIEIEL